MFEKKDRQAIDLLALVRRWRRGLDDGGFPRWRAYSLEAGGGCFVSTARLMVDALGAVRLR